MPSRPKHKGCANPIFAQWLLERVEEYDSVDDKNRCMGARKAYNAMVDYKEFLPTIDDARKVKGVGPKFVDYLRSRDPTHASALDPSSSTTTTTVSKKRGRPSADDRSSRPAKRRASDSALLHPQATGSRVGYRDLRPSTSLPLPIPQNTATNFEFWYLDEANKRVKKCQDAYFTQTSQGQYAYKIEISRGRDHEHFLTVVDTITIRGQQIGYLPIEVAELYPSCPCDVPRTLSQELSLDPQAPLRRTGLTLDPSRVGSTSTAAFSRHSSIRSLASTVTFTDDDDLDLVVRPTPKPIARTSSLYTGTQAQPSRTPLARSQTMPTTRTPAATIPVPPRRANDILGPTTPIQRTGRARLSGALPNPLTTQDDSFDFESNGDDSFFELDNYTGFEIHSSSKFGTFVPVTVRAHEYDIVLLLDNREKDKHSQHLYDRLSNNVPVERRALTIADVAWIAKRKPQYRQGDEFDEVALDAVLERKRIDDLCGSIKDGRFHEQKFRLHHSGITQVFYVVEEYGNIQHIESTGFTQQAIDTALSSTQVCDGFMVKETKALADTVSYYQVLHRAISQLYHKKDLHVLPFSSLHRHNYIVFQQYLRRRHPDKSYLTSYRGFEFLNSKSGFITVQTTWARMLLTVKGLSAEKVGCVVANFPTLSSLDDHFELEEGRERNELEYERVNGLPKGKRKSQVKRPWEKLGGLEIASRKVGEVNARKVYDLLRADSYDD
ncbi:hypothetical protein DL96DRAFT_505331 [Flagelloscypha sp. PMI_526]|nr:hypothetical protein DL96DRAFT_505331 [Flagelloscypha sp. PMI_526]